jgi:putative ABC transport system permease protein
MTSGALAWRTVTAERARAVLALIGVTVIGALLFDMLLLSRGLLVSFRELLDSTGYDVRVTATDSVMFRAPIRHAAELARDIAGLPEVKDVAILRRELASLQVDDKHRDVTVLSVSPGAAERQAWRIVSGMGFSPEERLDDPPLIVSRRLAESLRLSPGSSVRLRISPPGESTALPSVEMRVVGIAEFVFETGEDLPVAVSPEGLDRARATRGDDEADVVLVKARPESGSAAVVAAIRQRRPDVQAFSNEQIVGQLSVNGFAYFRQISYVLSTITLGFAFLLVATLLTVSVNQRLGQVAALRALGLPRRRIAATLLWETVWLVGVGGLLSVPVGWALASQLDRILRQMPGIPDRVHFFVFEPSAVLVHLALLAVTGAVAAVYPIWIATRLPIAATLRLETIS